MTYGLGASWIVSFIKKNSAIWVNRIGGVLMLITAILLALKSIKDY
jgi:cytochrome c biogenesis protein CcdA